MANMAGTETADTIPIAKSIPISRTPFYSIEFPGYIPSDPPAQSQSLPPSSSQSQSPSKSPSQSTQSIQSPSIQKALTRLGGINTVSEAFRKNLKIDLRLKDKSVDPLSLAHLPSGQAISTHNLVLKVVRRKRKQNQTQTQGQIQTQTQVDERADTERDVPITASAHSHINVATDTRGNNGTSKGQFTAEVVGICQKTMRFRTPIDFQYMPPLDDPVIKLREALQRLDADYILSYCLPEEKEDYTLSPEEQQSRGLASSSNVRAFPPPLFSRYDVPMNYNFKPNPASVQQTVVDSVTGETSTRLVNTGRILEGFPITIRMIDPSPTECGKDREGIRHRSREDLIALIEKKLEERPIWTRTAMANQLEEDDARFLLNNKHLWAVCTYAFSDGPWRDTVIKFGYDPRQDPEAVHYQIVSLRNLKNPTIRASVMKGVSTTAETKRDSSSHIFDGTTVRSLGTFQFIDITDSMVRQFIDDPNHRITTCNDRDGWLDSVTADRIKALMKFKHQRLLDTGKAPTMEECAQFLVPDESYMPFSGSRRHDLMHKGKRKRAKHKVALPEEEIAARRLERAVYGSDNEESRIGMGMDIDG